MAAHIDNLENTLFLPKDKVINLWDLQDNAGYDESHFNIVNVTLGIF